MAIPDFLDRGVYQALPDATKHVFASDFSEIARIRTQIQSLATLTSLHWGHVNCVTQSQSSEKVTWRIAVVSTKIQSFEYSPTIANQFMNVVQKHIQLRDLQSGQIAKVMSISGDPREIARIASLGLRTGEVISVTRGGITSIIQFCNGTRFCLRMSNSLEIFVETL